MNKHRLLILGTAGLFGVAAFGAFSLNVRYGKAADGKTAEAADIYNSVINDVATEDETNESDEKIYAVGSVSKVYVTTCVMQLAEQGKVELDTPVTEYISGFKMADERYKDITVRMLMNHTSGIMGSTEKDWMLYDDNDMSAHDHFLEALSSQRLKADPGEYACYCNDGFTLLEILVEEVSGMSYTDYLEKNVASKINAEHTGTPVNTFRDPMQAEIITNNNIFYDTDYCMAIGSGGVRSTATELARFGSTFFKGDNRLLTEKSKSEMATQWNKGNSDIYKEANGLGWDYVTESDYGDENVTLLGKGGSIDRQHAYLVVAPEQEVSVATLTAGGDGTDNEIFAEELMEVVLEDMGFGLGENNADENAMDTDNADENDVDDVQFEETIPDEYKRFNGYYILYSAGGTEAVYLSCGEEVMELSYLYRGTSEKENFKLTEDGSFVKIDEDGTISVDKETIHFEEKGDSVYIKADIIYDYIGLGKEDFHMYAGEKLSENEVSDKALSAWQQFNGKILVDYNEKYSSTEYDTPFMVVELPETLPGYLKFSAPGGFGDTLQIKDEKTAVSFTTMPSSANRDLIDLYLGHEKLNDGTEVNYVESIKGQKYRAIEDLPVFDSKISSVELTSGEAAWYKIGDDIAGSTISVERPEESCIYVYNKYFELVYSTHMHLKNENIPLPAGGYIVFIGETGGTVTQR